MTYIINYSKWKSLFESADLSNAKELSIPISQILLDGTSSSGKSTVLKGLESDWCVLAADEFYDLIGEELGEVEFENIKKISEVYPGCPYKFSESFGDNYESACRWYMAHEVKFGKVKSLGMASRNSDMGRDESQTKVIYDDVQGTIITQAESVGLPKPRWILVHAPIDHLILNILSRPAGDSRDPKGVFCGAYCFKFRAEPRKGGVDPKKSWTRAEVKEVLADYDWVNEFLSEVGIVDEGVQYWMHTKEMPEGEYDVIVNTRNSSGDQLSIKEVTQKVSSNFR